MSLSVEFLKQENEKLNKELSQISRELNAKKMENQQLMSTVMEQHAALDQAVGQLETYTRHKSDDSTSIKLEKLMESHKNLQEMHESSQKCIDNLRGLIQERDGQVLALKKNLKALKFEYDKKIVEANDFKEIKAKLELELRSCLERIREFQSQRRANSEVVDEAERAKERTIELESELEKTKRNLETANQEIVALRKENTVIRQESTKGISQVVAQMSKYNAFQAKFQDLVSELERRTLTLSNTQKEMSMLRNDYDTIKAQLHEAKTYIEYLEKANLTKQGSNLESEEALDFQTRRNAELEEALRNARRERDNARDQSQASKREIDHLRRKVDDLEHQLLLKETAPSNLRLSLFTEKKAALPSPLPSQVIGNQQETNKFPQIGNKENTENPLADETFIAKEKKISQEAVDTITSKIKDLESIFRNFN